MDTDHFVIRGDIHQMYYISWYFCNTGQSYLTTPQHFPVDIDKAVFSDTQNFGPSSSYQGRSQL